MVEYRHKHWVTRKMYTQDIETLAFDFFLLKNVNAVFLNNERDFNYVKYLKYKKYNHSVLCSINIKYIQSKARKI